MKRKLLSILVLLLFVSGAWAQSTADIGKVLAADGKMYKTVAAATNAGTTASGIIAYWGSAGSVESGNSTYRGMAIALKDAVLTWGSKPNHMEYCTSVSHQCSTATPYCSTASAAVNAKSGIAATQSALANNGEGHWHNAAGNGDGVALPSGASAWAIPSIGQWNLMAQGLTGNSSNLSDTDNPDYHYNNLSTKIVAAGGTHLEWLFYWSSTEQNESNAWCFNIGGLDSGRNGSRVSAFAKNHNDQYMHVRMFFAFSSAEAAVYTISYNANGGSGAPSSQTKDGGIDLTLSSTVPTRSGYAFAGWNTVQNGSGTSYAAGASYSANDDVTLYAQWTPIASYNVTANSASEAYWATFYSNAGNYQASEGTQVFTVHLEGTGIKMNEVGDRIAKSGEGVVLKKTTTGDFTMTLTETVPAGDFSSNSLDGTMTVINTTGANDYYVLGGKNGAGFYKLSASGTIGANKAYLTYPASARGFFLFDETTGVEMPTAEGGNDDAVVFDLQGRRVLNPTKGLYIVNGKKVFIIK